MKIKQIIIGLILMITLLLVACTPEVEVESDPTLTITSQKEVVIGLADSYELTYDVNDHVRNIEVVVTEKDNGTGGHYDAESQLFTATSGGEYTLVVTATNVEKQVSDNVIITVIDSEPTITLESGAKDKYIIVLGEDLVLPHATAKDALGKEIDVTLSVTQGATVTSESDEYVFSATIAGNYEVTYRTEDDFGYSAQLIITVSVSPTEKPTISFLEGKEDTYTINVGEVLVLPSATAKDGLDQDVLVEVIPTNQFGVSFKENEDQTFEFKTTVAGKHLISYYAEDDYGNYEELFIEVIVEPVHEETSIDENENDIDNLNTSNLVYKENFEKGYLSDLARGIVWDGAVKVSIDGGEDAISGNSMIFDFSEATATTNTAIYFGAMDSYIKSGRWQISFDVKKIKGNAPNFYVSFIFEGDNSGDNVAYTLNDGVTHIEYNYIKSFDSDKQWYLRLFTYTGNTSFDYDGLKLALDNFEIKWIEVEDPTYERTTEPYIIEPSQLDGDGYTLTGDNNNYSQLGGSGTPKWVQIDKLVAGDILTEEQVELLTSDNGFSSPYAILATTQQVYFDSLKNLLTDPNYVYTVTYKVYSPTKDSWHFWIAKEDTSQAYASGMPNDAGIKSFSHTLFGKPEYVNVGLYSGNTQTLLIGDIHVSRELYVPADTTPNGHEVGKTWTISSFLQESYDASTIEIESGVYLNSIDGFQGNVLKQLDNSNTADKNTVAFNGSDIFEQVGKYKITLTMYVVSLEGGPLMVNIDNQVFDAVYSGTEVGKVVVDYIVEGKTLNFFSIYTQNETTTEAYFAKIQIELIDIQ